MMCEGERQEKVALVVVALMHVKESCSDPEAFYGATPRKVQSCTIQFRDVPVHNEDQEVVRSLYIYM